MSIPSCRKMGKRFSRNFQSSATTPGSSQILVLPLQFPICHSGIFSPAGLTLCLGQLRTNWSSPCGLFVRIQLVAQHWNSRILPILRSADGWRDSQASALFIATIALSFCRPSISQKAKAHIYRRPGIVKVLSFKNGRTSVFHQTQTNNQTVSAPPQPGAVPHWIHLHRDRHDVLAMRRGLLLWVCQLQRLRGDGGSPPYLLPQPAHQGATHQLEPNGEYQHEYAAKYMQCSAMDGCFAHIVWSLLQVGSVKIVGGSQQKGCEFNLPEGARRFLFRCLVSFLLVARLPTISRHDKIVCMRKWLVVPLCGPGTNLSTV